MSDPDDRDPRLVDLACAFADQCMVVRQRPEPGVERRVSFPDGSVGERLEGDPLNDGEVIRFDVRWRVTEGDNLARQWVESELLSMERAVEQRISISSDLVRANVPWSSLEPPMSERVSVRGDTMSVSLWYPRVDGEPIKRIRLDLMDVRAADGLTISYDFDRDGWAIARDVTEEEHGALTGEVREVGFVPAWTDWTEPEAWNVAGVQEGVRRSIAWLRDHGHEQLADELEHEAQPDPA